MSVLRFVPRKLKSWLCPFIRRSQDKYRTEVEKKLMPLITERLRNSTELKEGGSKAQDKPVCYFSMGRVYGLLKFGRMIFYSGLLTAKHLWKTLQSERLSLSRA